MKCRGCMMYTGEYKPRGDTIVDLPGGWTINHYGSSEGYLGWLALQPRIHRMNLAELSPIELQSLGENTHQVETALTSYWQANFPCDPLERMYIVYYFESVFDEPKHEDFHLHIHLIPRPQRLYPLLKEGSVIIA